MGRRTGAAGHAAPLTALRLCRSADQVVAAHRAAPNGAIGLVLGADDSTLQGVELAADEARELAAIAHAERRRERTARRKALRLLIGIVTGNAMAPLARGPAGEVELASGRLFLSSSSRAGIVAAAIGPLPLGIDLEQPLASDHVPWALLHPAEQAALRGAEAERAGRLWAAKEAVWKACRMPLARDPASFAVVPDAGGAFSAEGKHGMAVYDAALGVIIAHAQADCVPSSFLP